MVTAAIQEDVQGVAISSYQGGHIEYFGYLRERLDEAGAGHVKVYGGGGGVIVPAEIAALAQIGVRIFSPQDGQRLGLPGMINELIADCDVALTDPPDLAALQTGSSRDLARAYHSIENGTPWDLATREVPVLGITGTGGSGKSSLTDEIVRRLRRDSEDKIRVAVLAIDPTRRFARAVLCSEIGSA